VYIDDTFGVNHCYQSAWLDFNRANEWNNFLGIEENLEKAVPPTQVATILGYEVDTLQITVSMPSKKICELQILCEKFANSRHTYLCQLQALIGNLVFVACIVCGGWSFMARMLPLLKLKSGSSNPCIFLMKPFQEDFHWWISILCNWSRIARIPTNREIHVFCDASSAGFGAWWKEAWFAGRWNLTSAK
jgi:hypothetical protein